MQCEPTHQSQLQRKSHMYGRSNGERLGILTENEVYHLLRTYESRILGDACAHPAGQPLCSTRTGITLHVAASHRCYKSGAQRNMRQLHPCGSAPRDNRTRFGKLEPFTHRCAMDSYELKLHASHTVRHVPQCTVEINSINHI